MILKMIHIKKKKQQQLKKIALLNAHPSSLLLGG